MISIAKTYSFDAAHRLWDDERTEDENEKVFGKCARLHGHTYQLTVEVSGDVDPNTGMVLNYFDLDDIVKPFVNTWLDHRDLNIVFDVLTTAENLVLEIKAQLQYYLGQKYHRVKLESVTIQETPKTKATWHRKEL